MVWKIYFVEHLYILAWTIWFWLTYDTLFICCFGFYSLLGFTWALLFAEVCWLTQVFRVLIFVVCVKILYSVDDCTIFDWTIIIFLWLNFNFLKFTFLRLRNTQNYILFMFAKIFRLGAPTWFKIYFTFTLIMNLIIFFLSIIIFLISILMFLLITSRFFFELLLWWFFHFLFIIFLFFLIFWVVLLVLLPMTIKLIILLMLLMLMLWQFYFILMTVILLIILIMFIFIGFLLIFFFFFFIVRIVIAIFRFKKVFSLFWNFVVLMVCIDIDVFFGDLSAKTLCIRLIFVLLLMKFLYFLLRGSQSTRFNIRIIMV